ncbi:ABC transporter substrate-binding protein [Chitinibacter tainanensis]|uniref:ABC transporter substrate-binding protein n=1 Tax=Chitinibacter tainanensis TaxID=230667 RepID=UPI000402E89B|nr:ABC transporter substrate-binding protein [Chitinibacter tainanensis]
MFEYKAKILALGLLLSLPLQAAESLDVLHWWTSASERAAARFLQQRLADERIDWHDAAIPGGGGIGAMRVLKSRVLAGKQPAVAQLIGPAIAEWADLGLILELDTVARYQGWSKALSPTVYQLLQHREHVVAAPLGVHRINNLYYNAKLFRKLGIAEPHSSEDLKRAALRLAAADVVPFGQSSEPWQVATLFETLVLAEGGPAFYRELFVKRNPQAYLDVRFANALQRLRQIRAHGGKTPREQSWTEIAQQLANGQVGMVIMGDWFKGELQALGKKLDTDFVCTTLPGTANWHLYSVDTLVMFAGDYSQQQTQEKMAQALLSPPVQHGYNRLKGSVTVRRDLSRVEQGQLDRCALNSWQTFNRGSAVQAPSLVHRMASDEKFKDAVVAQVHKFYLDDGLSVADNQQRMAAMVRALNIQENNNDDPKNPDR